MSKTNPWMVVSGVLAIALVVSLGMFFSGGLKGGSLAGADDELSADAAAAELLNFVNTVFAPQVGQSELRGVREVNGLYEVTLFIASAPADQTTQIVFVTKNGALFIPQALDIATAQTQFEQLQAQGTVPPVDVAPTPTPTPTDEDLDLQQ